MNSKTNKREISRGVDMEVIFLVGLAVGLGLWISRKKAGGADTTAKLDTEKDDFAGTSIGTYFLLDELVDNPQGTDKGHKQAERTTPEDVDFIDEEAFFEDELS